jgi:hypothetical protein
MTDEQAEALRHLAKKWRRQQLDYPATQAGEHAAAAVRCCADELDAEIERLKKSGRSA